MIFSLKYLSVALMATCGLANALADLQQPQLKASQDVAVELERALAQATHANVDPSQEQESHQRVNEAMSRLLQSMTSNSIGNVRRLVARLTDLVGSSQTTNAPNGPSKTADAARQSFEQARDSNYDQQTEQLVQRLNSVNRQTAEPQTLRKLNEDVSRLVSSLGDAYLRNMRRLIERAEQTLGKPGQPQGGNAAQAPDRLDESSNSNKEPGFPGWDELLVAVDRMQKSVASFVRSSTRLVTSG